MGGELDVFSGECLLFLPHLAGGGGGGDCDLDNEAERDLDGEREDSNGIEAIEKS